MCRRRYNTTPHNTNLFHHHTNHNNNNVYYQHDNPTSPLNPFLDRRHHQFGCCTHIHDYTTTPPLPRSMASLLLFSLGFGAIKIKEHRDEKKARRAAATMQDWDDLASELAMRTVSGTTTTNAMGGGRLGNFRDKVTGRRKRDVAPPSYQEVVEERV